MTDSAYALMKIINNGEEVLGRYWDMIHPKPADNRSGEEIADDVIKRLGLKVVG